MIPGDLLSAFPHRQFHTLPGLLESWAALPNSNPSACMPKQGGSLYHFYDGLWYDPAERRTHALPCERRTRYRLSQPDTVVSSDPSCISVFWYCVFVCVICFFRPFLYMCHHVCVILIFSSSRPRRLRSRHRTRRFPRPLCITRESESPSTWAISHG